MIAVIFEAEAREGERQAYLDTAAALRPLLERVPGFISIERFESLSTPAAVSTRSAPWPFTPRAVPCGARGSVVTTAWSCNRSSAA